MPALEKAMRDHGLAPVSICHRQEHGTEHIFADCVPAGRPAAPNTRYSLEIVPLRSRNRMICASLNIFMSLCVPPEHKKTTHILDSSAAYGRSKIRALLFGPPRAGSTNRFSSQMAPRLADYLGPLNSPEALRSRSGLLCSWGLLSKRPTKARGNRARAASAPSRCSPCVAPRSI